MLRLGTVCLALLAPLVLGHFELDYPYWRGDSFTPPASQYIYPCANINQSDATNTNRTLWPLDGGSVLIRFDRPFSYVWINLGMGGIIAGFNYTLTPMPLYETGNGTICIPKLPLPADIIITEVTDASLQVIMVGNFGSTLYNCADIRFTSNATILSGDQCMNSTGLTLEPLEQQVNGTISQSSKAAPSSTEPASASKSSSSAYTKVRTSYAAVLAAMIPVVLALV